MLPARTAVVLLASLLAAACADDAAPSEPGPDASPAEGGPDAASPDGGVAEPDAEPLPTPDADPPDADAAGALDPTVDPAWRASEEDFGCLTDWTGVRGFFLTNLHGLTDEAVAVAEAGFVDAVPPGTIVQLVPLEAMVKLAPGALPETGDWEYLLLDTSRGATTIQQRGGVDVENAAGSCYGCHLGAIGRDYVCEDSGLCSAGNVPRAVVDRLVANDSRCR